jgi:hypothetical protein
MGLFGNSAEISTAAADPWNLPDGIYEGSVGEIETYVDPEGKFTCTNIDLVAEDGRSYTLRLYHPEETDTEIQRQRKLSNIRRFYEGLEIPVEKMDEASAEDIQAAGESIVFRLVTNTSKKNNKTYQNLYSIQLAQGSGMTQRLGDNDGLSEFARASAGQDLTDFPD